MPRRPDRCARSALASLQGASWTCCSVRCWWQRLSVPWSFPMHL